MADFPCPKITIEGVPVLMQNFSWSLTPGVQPHMMSFKVSLAIDQALRNLVNPVTIRGEFYGGTRGTPDQEVREISNLYLIEPKQINPFEVMWQIADSRFSWRGKKVFAAYNKTRKHNYQAITVTDEITPAALRHQFDTFPIGRWLPWSLFGMERLWKVREMLEDQLAKLGIPFASVGGTPGGDDGDYPLENIEFNGVDIYQALAHLLQMSRLQLGIRTDGTVYVYSIDYFDDTEINLIAQWQHEAKTGPGTIFMGEKKRIRPRKVHVWFEQEMEIRVVGATSEDSPAAQNTLGPNFRIPVTANPPLWTQTEIDRWRVIGAENVIRVPYPVKRHGYNYDYQTGEYVPLWEYLLSITPALTQTEIQNRWFGENLERYYAAQVDGGNPNKPNEQIIRQIISAIKSSYRQLYQLDPYIMDRIRSWSPRRCVVIDNFSRYSPPSPLFADYCLIPSRRHPSLAKRLALWDEAAYNWLIDDRDPQRVHPTAGTVHVIDQALGIFQVSYPSLPDSHTARIVPTGVDPLPGISVTGTLLESCHLRSTHTMDTIVSVIWDNYMDAGFDSPTKYYVVSFDYAAHGGEGPEIDYLSTLDYARLGVKEYQTSSAAAGAIGGVVLGTYTDDRLPVNLGPVQAMAQAEAAKIMNQFRDRYTGLVTLAGWIPFRLTGNMKGITYQFSPGRGLETTIDLRDAPPSPTVEQSVPARVLAYLKKQVTRASERWIAK